MKWANRAKWSQREWDIFLINFDSPRVETVLENGADIEDFSDQKTPWDFIPAPERAYDAETMDRLRKALRSLSLQERRIISFHILKGLNLAAVAKHLELDRSTVRVFLNRALIKLRTRMEGGEKISPLSPQNESGLARFMSPFFPIVEDLDSQKPPMPHAAAAGRSKNSERRNAHMHLLQEFKTGFQELLGRISVEELTTNEELGPIVTRISSLLNSERLYDSPAKH